MEIKPIEDGLAIPEVGVWCRRKYHFLGRYLEAFTTAMRDKWPQLHYIDLFAGAGFARIRDTGELVLGSPMLAAGVKHPFTRLHFCELDRLNFHALQKRLERFNFTQRAQVLHGDANESIRELLKDIPTGDALCITFADPYGLHLDFETIRTLERVRSDLIVLLADNMDALRNWAEYYIKNPDSSLDRFLGEAGWRDSLTTSPSDSRAQRLRERYTDRLRSLGYTHFAHERVQNSKGRDIYTLLFASRSEAGRNIWTGISAIDEVGQRRLPFSS